ncbi:class I SAM-dependent methyltransferase [Dactylosporangium roseum]|uniref:Class I SAM-dependent methyltransferase n=1 Tax=Dactylosporangium roseum TaxID=47989 RepID=A0ABY5YZR9_9ACTN|nr:cyclopropane-fatty-acyl-phospholipid synthase family protein [Dactylosporangium roseum]UWZ34702.1 class I SAM-dependent methyltransferase [Dactylosporangium roseum]
MSTQADIEVSYDVGNEFFALWLDEQRNYSCALWQGADDDLEAAQRRKLAYLSDLAGTGPQTRVLDIGCGWGANMHFQVEQRGVSRVCGITLSPSQLQFTLARELPGATAELRDYRDYRTDEPFDALISIGMLEHVVRPDQVWSGEHLAVYADFFRRAHSWSRPGARFGLQVILRDRIPRDREDLARLQWVTNSIFPGGMSPRLEDIYATAEPYWEIVSLRTRRDHYRRTCAEWLRRLRGHEDTIRQRWGDQVYLDYERYLSICVLAFERRYQSLAQFGLRRRDLP